MILLHSKQMPIVVQPKRILIAFIKNQIFSFLLLVFAHTKMHSIEYLPCLRTTKPLALLLKCHESQTGLFCCWKPQSRLCFCSAAKKFTKWDALSPSIPSFMVFLSFLTTFSSFLPLSGDSVAEFFTKKKAQSFQRPWNACVELVSNALTCGQ